MLEQQIVETVREWLVTYVAQPHPSIRRTGAVCPFVQPALDAGSLELRVYSTLAPAPEAYVLEVSRRSIAEFPPPRLRAYKSSLRALVLIFPDLIGRGDVIDRVHAAIKDEAVQTGLMVGQLHPACTEPSARNGEFLVNRSPVPMLVIRHMAIHDILFLNSRKSWFHEYDRRFGRIYNSKHKLDRDFSRLHELAAIRFGHWENIDCERKRTG